MLPPLPPPPPSNPPKSPPPPTKPHSKTLLLVIVPHTQTDDTKKGENLLKEFTSSTDTDTKDADDEVNIEEFLDISHQSDVDDEFYCIELYFIDVKPLHTVFLNTNTTSDDVEGGGGQHAP